MSLFVYCGSTTESCPRLSPPCASTLPSCLRRMSPAPTPKAFGLSRPPTRSGSQRSTALASLGLVLVRRGHFSRVLPLALTTLRSAGDHFKTTLLPLFQLYRTPSTPSNRHLLLTILGRLLTTPILFGESSLEVEVWLAALPTPSQDPTSTDGANLVLDFFERCVQKTLTAPIKAAAMQDGAASTPTSSFSPLLATVLGGLAAQVEEASAEAVTPLLAFVRRVFYGFIGQSQSSELPKSLAAGLKKELSASKAAKGTLKLLKECVKSLEEQVDAQVEESLAGRLAGDEKEEVLSALSPAKENVFASLSEDAELLNS